MVLVQVAEQKEDGLNDIFNFPDVPFRRQFVLFLFARPVEEFLETLYVLGRGPTTRRRVETQRQGEKPY